MKAGTLSKVCFSVEAFILLLVLVFFSSLFSPINAYASPPFAPGETLDPTCLPTNPDCKVLTQWTPNGSSLYYNAGNVGIGTTTPASAIDVVGNINTSGNFKIGGKTVLSTDESNSNVLLGEFAGQSNTTGSYNFFGGWDAGTSNTTGSFNTFLGAAVGESNTTGFGNVFTGYSAGDSNTTGNSNIFTGYDAGLSNTTGSSNIFTGYGAGQNNTTGSFNVFTGLQAGVFNTTGIGNIFSGYSAGQGNTTGNYNIFSGLNTGTSNTTGDSNTFLGTASGQSNTTGSQNTLIGYGADLLSGDLTNATAIGAGAKVGASNSLVLGGTGESAVNVGIGTSTPEKALSVVGDGIFTGNGIFGGLQTNTIESATGPGTGAITFPGSTNGNYVTINPNWYGSLGAYIQGGSVDGSSFMLGANNGAFFTGFNISDGSTRIDLDPFKSSPGDGKAVLSSNGSVSMEFTHKNGGGSPDSSVILTPGNIELNPEGPGSVTVTAGGSLNVDTIKSATGPGTGPVTIVNGLQVAGGTVSPGGYMAVGNGATASALYSTAIGAGTSAGGNYSTAMGAGTTANGEVSTAMGQSTTATGNYSTAMGQNTTANGNSQTTIGKFNISDTFSAFIIGNGTDGSSLSNALTVDWKGNTNIASGAGYQINGANVLTASTTLGNYFVGNSGNLTMTGDSNTALGGVALLSNTTGTSNTSVGNAALVSNTTGNNNTADGALALGSNTSGSQNVAVGTASLNLNTTGGNNTAVGNASLAANTTGSDNIAFGLAALNINSTGSSNTAIGESSLSTNTTGSNNTALGIYAGEHIADGSTSNTTSSNSLYLGANTKALASGDTNEIVIGSGAIGVGSNSAILGNSSITKTVLNGNVGVGTSTPSSKLQIVGTTEQLRLGYDASDYSKFTVGSTGGLTFTPSGNTTAAYNFTKADGTTSLMELDATNGRIGIGTTTMNSMLDVNGGETYGVGQLTAAFGGLVGIGQKGSDVGSLSLFSATGQEIRLFAHDGNAVISNSSSDLHITPAVNVNITQGNLGIAGNSAYMINGTNILSASTTLNNLLIGATVGTSTMSGSNNIFVGASVATGITSGADNTLMGESAGHLLTSGTDNTIVGHAAGLSLTNGGSDTFVGQQAGEVTTGSDNSFFGRFAGFNNTTGSNNTYVGFQAGATDGTVATLGNLSNATAIGYNAEVRASNSLVLGGTGAYAVNVGIGTTTPAAALDVIGAVCVDDSTPTCGTSGLTAGTIYAVNAFSQTLDLAESYPTSDDTLQAGELVALDETHPVFVKRASISSGDGHLLLGVISTKPGFYLGGFDTEYPGVKKVPIALSGRVPVKVNLQGGPISIGDKISLSSVAGVGKKAGVGEDTVGLALEDFSGSYTSNNDTILVFVQNRQASILPAFGQASLASEVFSTLPSSVQSAFTDLGILASDSISYVKNLVVEKITAIAGVFQSVETVNIKAQTAEIDSGISLKDKVTEIGRAHV
ncbi:MAG: hypothetical protein PHV42_03350 [Candidatus Pacebacteria bacterium]|nr:hypothetical protein [Candidatus Paceibacterota bacterium]